ncbi:HesB/IscA family protein [Ferruginivarius sediminum]|uniref:Iron-sulfur cluster assembly accessory protein n=1 Tax=Ferruginivarius sediminum TaxID=2661937 RepID=A0A369T5Z2_9PROT|nr:iron-sulfur cluster assembly accessory protein [Ferruginivarius sediminum]RDD60739.1 iron-sulfur cluster assembly accessory protein [Ferruginivarius sediminum]
MPGPAMISLTDAAADRVKALIAKSDRPVQGLRIGVRTKGCSGLSYHFEYAEDQKPTEDVINDKGVKIFIDPASVIFLFGSEIDYKEGKLESGFVFNNPNEKGRCGCGESFTV